MGPTEPSAIAGSVALQDRYGTPRGGRRGLVVAVAGVASVVFTAWLVWAAWFHSTPEVRSELIAFEVVDQHTATAVVEVSLGDGVEATCLVRALADDHTPVGDFAFTPRSGRNEVELRTERRATSVEGVGCTAKGQTRPR